MNRTSKQIEIELNQTTNRLDELTEMRSGITANLKTLQDGFIGGEKPLDEVQAEQSRLDTLDGSIKALEAKQSEIQNEFDKFRAIEGRRNLLEKANRVGIEAEAALNAYLKIISDFNEIVGEYGGQMLDAVCLYHTKRKEFQELFAQTGFGTLEGLGLTRDRHEILTVKYINYPPTEYGEIIHTAQRIVSNKRDREEQIKAQTARQAKA